MTARAPFPEGGKLPDPPQVVHAGRAFFGDASSTTVTLPYPVRGDYIVLVTGRGECGGASAKVADVFSVVKRSPESFVIETSNNRCRQSVDFVVVVTPS